MTKLLGLSLVFGAAALGLPETASAGHGCQTQYHSWQGQPYYQPAYSHQPTYGYHSYQPGYYQPAPQMTQVPGTQMYRGFSYEPGTATAPAVTPQATVPSVAPSYQGTYTAPQRFGGADRPSFLDAGRKIRGNFGR